MKKILFIIILSGLLFGTNNYQELNNIAIITNIGITKNKNDYKLIYQEILPIKEDNKLLYKYKYYNVSGPTLNDCFKNIDEIISKEIYLQHLENIIIKSNNKDIIYDLNNYFNNDLDNFFIVFTKNNVKSVIKYGNYNYINSIVKNKLSYRDVKKAKLENKKIEIPFIKFKDDTLIFYKYQKSGDDNE